MPFAARTAARLISSSALFSALTCLAAAPAPKRPPITGIAHVALAAQSISADRAYYTHYLGWQAVASPEFADGVRFYGNPHQTVEVRPAKSKSELAFQHVEFSTPDASALRLYLQSKGVQVPAALTLLSDGEQLFLVKDPEGNTIGFVQPAGHSTSAAAAPALPIEPMPPAGPQNISGRIIHAGFLVRSAPTEDKFYRDILGFRLYWMGGMKDSVTDFVSLQVPNGTDWIEYMLNAPAQPSAHQIGVDDHFSLGVPHMDPVVAAFKQRGFPPNGQTAKQMGRDGKYQFNIYDPDGVRIEYMELTPAETPCCHPFTGPQPTPTE